MHKCENKNNFIGIEFNLNYFCVLNLGINAATYNLVQLQTRISSGSDHKWTWQKHRIALKVSCAISDRIPLGSAFPVPWAFGHRSSQPVSQIFVKFIINIK